MALSSADLASGPVFDPREVARLREQARQAPQSEAVQRQVARQFEALFLNMLIQRMREATPQDGLFDSAQTRLAQSLADQQMASSLADPGIGLAQALLRQMRQGLGAGLAGPVGQAGQAGQDTEARAGDALARPPAQSPGSLAQSWIGLLGGVRGDGAARRADDGEGSGSGGGGGGAGAAPGARGAQGALGPVADFVARLAPAAGEVARAAGIPFKLILGQAALETGWGQREIRHADGSPSHNLFGIKASGGWTGKTVEVATTEYEQGVARKVVQTFRAYDSYGEALRDYAALITGNPRYRSVRQASDHNEAARRIQASGYATDPAYADKLIRVMAMLDGRG